MANRDEGVLIVPELSVSVVVPTHNGGELLLQCLRSIAAQQSVSAFELIVVDDRSTDDTIARVRAAFPDARIVSQEENRGPGAARNLGWRSATGEIIGYLDHDVTVDPFWLAHALSHFHEGAIDGLEGRTEVADADKITPFTHWTKNLTGGQYPFCNMFLRRATLEYLGGFDERFYDRGRKVHFREDIEIVFRALDAGRSFRFAHDVIAYHPPLPGAAGRPLKLARRYYFDPLLKRLHPGRFNSAVEIHSIGPVRLRRPRHWAAFCNVAAAALMLATVRRKRRFWPMVAPLYLLSYLFPLAAATRHNRVSAVPKHTLAMATVVFVAVPWVYLWAYMRGLWAFRHVRPSDRIPARDME